MFWSDCIGSDGEIFNTYFEMQDWNIGRQENFRDYNAILQREQFSKTLVTM